MNLRTNSKIIILKCMYTNELKVLIIIMYKIKNP